MKRVYGWDYSDEYGWFMTAALVPLSLAILALVVVHLLVARYNWKLADGDFGPATRLAQSDGVPVLGATIGDVPGEASLIALRGELTARIPALPWKRVLVRHNTAAAPIAIQSYFFPFNTPAEAISFCHKVAAQAPGCTTVIASTNELTTPDGKQANAAVLARLGVTPYTGAGAPQTRVVYVQAPPRIITQPAPPPKIVYVPTPAKPVPAAPPPKPQIVYVPSPPKIVYLPAPVPAKPIAPTPAAPAKPNVAIPPPSQITGNVQAPLRLQPGVGSNTVRHPETLVWLSKTYKPGDARLTSVVGAGDVMMGSIASGLNPALKPGVDVATLVGNELAGIFRHADVAFLNLEGPLYEGSQGTGKNCAQCFAFRGPTHYAGVLRSLGVDVVSLANNHSGDYGEAGRNSTMAALRANGIVYGGLDRDDARVGEMVLPNGKKVAMIGFAPNNGTLQLNDIDRAAQLVRDLKKNHDLVIVSFHGGGEGWTFVRVRKGTETFAGENRGNVTAFAHSVIDAGADLVLGHGPHVPRAVEIYKGHLVAYSLGNFWTYAGVQTYAVSGMAPVLETWLAPDGSVAGFVIHSARQAGLGVPHLDPLDEAARYMLYLTRGDFPGTSALIAGHSSVAAATPAGGGT